MYDAPKGRPHEKCDITPSTTSLAFRQEGGIKFTTGTSPGLRWAALSSFVRLSRFGRIQLRPLLLTSNFIPDDLDNKSTVVGTIRHLNELGGRLTDI